MTFQSLGGRRKDFYMHTTLWGTKFIPQLIIRLDEAEFYLDKVDITNKNIKKQEKTKSKLQREKIK